MSRTTLLQERRMQTFQNVLGHWQARRLSALEAAEMLGMSERSFRRYRRRYEDDGLDGLFDRRLDKASARRVPCDQEAVKRIDALFDIERTINGETAERRLAMRQERSAPLVAELEDWMRTERAGLSRHASAAKAMDYMLKRWGSFARFLDDGRICMTNNAAERALRGIALGRKSWLFAGSDRGGERAAVMYTLIGTAKLNDADPQAWLADVLDRIADLPQTRLHELLPWHWKADRQQALAA